MNDMTIGIRLTADGSDLIGEVRGSRAELDKLGAAAKGAGRDAERGARGVDRFGDESRKTTHEARRLNVESKRLGRGFADLERRATLLKAAFLALATGAAARVVKSFVDAASTAEQFRVRLEVLLGDQAEASRLFAEMADYASRVPFQYEEVMAAATQLSGVLSGGVDDVKSWIPVIGDLAAASGLSIQQTTEQVIRMLSAGAASADLFRERGILAMLGFQAGVTYSVEETARRLREAWEDADSRFRGATEKLATTWGGLTSMMADKWFQFRNQVMDSEPFDYLKSAFSILNEDWGADAEGMRETARSIGEAVVEAARDISIGAAGIVDAVSPAVQALGQSANLLIEGFNKLPDWVQELGIAGALIFGRKGFAALAAISAARQGIDEWQDRVMHSLLGQIGLGGGSFEEFQTRMDALRAEQQERQGESLSLIRTLGDVSGTDFRGRVEDMWARMDEMVSRSAGEAGAAGGGRRRDTGFGSMVSGAIADAAEERDERHAETVKAIGREYAKLPKTLEQNIAAAQAWRREALAGLDRTKEGYAGFAREVDAVFDSMLEAAYEDHLATSREWEAGVVRGLRKYADEAGDAASQVESAIGSMARSGEDGFVRLARGAESFGDTMGAVLEDIGEEILRVFYRTQIAAPIAGGVTNLFSGLFASPSAGTSDGLYHMANVGHQGGQIGGPNAFERRAVPAGVFEGAPRLHGGGWLAPGERPIVAKEGEVVGWPEQMRRAFGGGDVRVEVYDQRGGGAAPVETREGRGPNGERVIRMWIRDEVGRGLDQGDYDGRLRSNYGVSRTPAVRRG